MSQWIKLHYLQFVMLDLFLILGLHLCFLFLEMLVHGFEVRDLLLLFSNGLSQVVAFFFLGQIVLILKHTKQCENL
jgi:hypothetical protein